MSNALEYLDCFVYNPNQNPDLHQFASNFCALFFASTIALETFQKNIHVSSMNPVCSQPSTKQFFVAENRQILTALITYFTTIVNQTNIGCPGLTMTSGATRIYAGCNIHEMDHY